MKQAQQTVLIASRESNPFAAPSRKNSQIELGISEQANDIAMDA